MRLIDAEWTTYVLRKIAQAEDKDLSKGEFGQGYVRGYIMLYMLLRVRKRVCLECVNTVI